MNFLKGTINAEIGDITQYLCDVIVTPTNVNFTGEGTTNVAVQKEAGAELIAECLEIGTGCPGTIAVTGGYNLKSKYIFHAIEYSFDNAVNNNIRDLYKNCLDTMVYHNLHSIAFPSLPENNNIVLTENFAGIAMDAICEWCMRNPSYPVTVTFFCQKEQEYSCFVNKMRAMQQNPLMCNYISV